MSRRIVACFSFARFSFTHGMKSWIIKCCFFFFTSIDTSIHVNSMLQAVQVIICVFLKAHGFLFCRRKVIRGKTGRGKWSSARIGRQTKRRRNGHHEVCIVVTQWRSWHWLQSTCQGPSPNVCCFSVPTCLVLPPTCNKFYFSRTFIPACTIILTFYIPSCMLML